MKDCWSPVKKINWLKKNILLYCEKYKLREKFTILIHNVLYFNVQTNYKHQKYNIIQTYLLCVVTTTGWLKTKRVKWCDLIFRTHPHLARHVMQIRDMSAAWWRGSRNTTRQVIGEHMTKFPLWEHQYKVFKNACEYWLFFKVIHRILKKI